MTIAPQNTSLPGSWTWTTLGDLVSPSKLRFQPNTNDERRFVGLEHIESDTGRILGVSSSSSVRSTKTVFHAGDVLYGRLRPYLNKACVPNFDGVCSTDILVFPQNEAVNSHYLASLLQTPSFVSFATQNMKGVQHPRIRFEDITRYPIPLAPKKEQHRIVVKIEELMTRLDAGIKTIQDGIAQLARYRQALLKSMFEGGLTKEWRKDNVNVETASSLLEHINREEERHTKVRKRRIRTIDENDLPVLPSSWVWVQIRDIRLVVTKGSTPTSYGFQYEKRGINFARVENLSNGRLDRASMVEFITSEANEFLKRSQLRESDVLFSIAGTIGRTAIVRAADLPCNTNQAVAIIRCPWQFVDPFYLRAALEAPIARSNLLKRPRGVGMQNVSLQDVDEIVIPFPPLAEQHEIAERTEYYLSSATKCEDALVGLLEASKRLRHSILSSAFKGTLVLQNPTDEPTSGLIEQIKQTKSRGD